MSNEHLLSISNTSISQMNDFSNSYQQQIIDLLLPIQFIDIKFSLTRVFK